MISAAGVHIPPFIIWSRTMREGAKHDATFIVDIWIMSSVLICNFEPQSSQRAGKATHREGPRRPGRGMA